MNLTDYMNLFYSHTRKCSNRHLIHFTTTHSTAPHSIWNFHVLRRFTFQSTKLQSHIGLSTTLQAFWERFSVEAIQLAVQNLSGVLHTSWKYVEVCRNWPGIETPTSNNHTIHEATHFESVPPFRKPWYLIFMNSTGENAY